MVGDSVPNQRDASAHSPAARQSVSRVSRQTPVVGFNNSRVLQYGYIDVIFYEGCVDVVALGVDTLAVPL